MHEHFDAHRAFEHVKELARHMRLPGSKGEKLAQAYIRGVGEDIGMPVREEVFTYSDIPMTVVLPVVCLAIATLCFFGSLAYFLQTALCLIPAVMLMLAVLAGFKWSSAFEHYGARGHGKSSMNLIGEIKGKDPKGVIMLSAHYDSKSQVMPVVVRAALFIIGFSGAILLGLALIVLGILKLAGTNALGYPPGFYISLVPAFLLFLLIFNFTGNRSPGALDNASGEAVILEVARILANRPLENYNVIVASFGCEEVGLCGSINYLLSHENELREKPFFMLNYDMPSSRSGRLCINTGFEFPPRLTSRKINQMARVIADSRGFEIKGIYLPVGAAADHMPWVRHGFEATGFVSAATRVHSSRDSVDLINREGLRRVGEMTIELVHMLDQELEAGREGGWGDSDFK